MNTPKFAPSLKNLRYDGLAKKLASINNFYKKYPAAQAPEVSADDPEKASKRSKS